MTALKDIFLGVDLNEEQVVNDKLAEMRMQAKAMSRKLLEREQAELAQDD